MKATKYLKSVQLSNEKRKTKINGRYIRTACIYIAFFISYCSRWILEFNEVERSTQYATLQHTKRDSF